MLRLISHIAVMLTRGESHETVIQLSVQYSHICDTCRE